MKVKCRDCRFGKKISDDKINYCPKCGSENIYVTAKGDSTIPETQPKISKGEKNIGKAITKVGAFLLMITLIALIINLVSPTYMSYSFILFIFPVQILISLITLVVGFIVEQIGGYFQRDRKIQLFCHMCGDKVSQFTTLCLNCGANIPIK